MRLVFLLVLVAACGGAQQGAEAKTGGHGPQGQQEESIAEIAGREGLPTLGGGGQGGGVGGSLRLELVDKDNPIKIDGVPKEWTLVPALGGAKGDGLAFKCALAYDGQSVFFAGDVTGVRLRHLRRFTDDEDHVSLVVASPGGAAVDVSLFPGKPGESAGVVRVHGRDIPGAKIVEADSDKGYTFEAQIPWSALAPPNIRVGLRGVARFFGPASGGARTVLATGNGDASSPHDMPALPTEPEEALIESFLAPKGLLATAPKFELLADVRGDAMKERVAVYDRYITVMGPNYRGGKEYFFRDLGSDIEGLEARDVTGRGKQDLVIRRTLGGPDTRQWLDVWAFFEDEPTTVFSHEISVALGANRVTNAVHLASKEIEVTYDPAVGFDQATYRQPRAIDTEPVLLPWGAVKSQTFRFDGSKFVKVKEVAQASAVATNTSPTITMTTTAQTTTTKPPSPPRAPTGGELLARYRADRGVPDSLRSRLDLPFSGNHAVLIGRDIVVHGPTFKGGTGYAFMTLSQFADAGDVQEMTVQGPYIVVRGVRHMNATTGSIDMTLMFVYEVKNDTITRVFGVEAGRAQGQNRVQGNVQLAAAQRGFEITVRPGRAQGWTDKTYPFTQDQPGSGALEPLLLPWGGIDHLRYAYNGSVFARVP